MGVVALVAFVLTAVFLLGLAERAYVGAVLRRHVEPVRLRRLAPAQARAVRRRLTWRFVVASYLLLFLFVALGKKALVDGLGPGTELGLYGLLSVPLIIAFLVYSTSTD